MPLFFKIRFTFVAMMIIAMIISMATVAHKLVTDPAVVGRVAGGVVRGYKETTK